MHRKLGFLAPLFAAVVVLLASSAASAQQLYQFVNAGALANVRGDALQIIALPPPEVFQVTVSGTLATVKNQAGLFDSTVAPGAAFTETFLWYTDLPASSNYTAGVSQSNTWSAAGTFYGVSGAVGDIALSSGSAATETVVSTDSLSVGSTLLTVPNSLQEQTNGVTLTNIVGSYNAATDFSQIYLSSPSVTPSQTDPSADWGDSWANSSILLKVTGAGGQLSSLAIGTISNITVTPTANVSGSVSVTVLGVTLNPGTRVYTYRMNLTNNGSSAIAGPVQVLVGNIPAGVTLSNSTGTAPWGSPFVTVSGGSVAPHASVGFTLTFADPKLVATNGFTTQTYSGSL